MTFTNNVRINPIATTLKLMEQCSFIAYFPVLICNTANNVNFTIIGRKLRFS